MIEIFQSPHANEAELETRVRMIESLIGDVVTQLGRERPSIWETKEAIPKHPGHNFRVLKVRLNGLEDQRVYANRFETMPGKINVSILNAIFAEVERSFPASGQKIIETYDRARFLPGVKQCRSLFESI